jgi:tRNA nucleotidyltransferase (CCA-adding enzyme)
MNLIIPAYVSQLMHKLEDSGYECYVVGGAVRSLLLDLPVHDYDLTSNALPEQMQKVFGSYHTLTTGLKHGTLTVINERKPVEITTYRKDSAYKDHRHPDAVSFTSAIEEDCARRDFTINAFCYSESRGILDFFHGREDLNARLIRAIGDPDKRFEEDALRILRAVRFAAQLRFNIEEKTSQALLSKRNELSYISMERIQEETISFLNASGCPSMFEKYYAVFEVFLPLPSAEEVRRHLYTCIYRSADDAIVRMALILTFADSPSASLHRLKYSNADRQMILNLISLQDHPLETRKDIRYLLHDLKAPLAAYLHYREALDGKDCHYVIKYCEEIEEKKECCHLKDMNMKGSDLVEMGYQGSRISAMLEECLFMVMDDTLPNNHEALTAYAKGRIS